MHPTRIKFENVWVGDKLNLMPYKTNQNFHRQFDHSKDIYFNTSSTDLSLLIGAEKPELHLPNEIGKGNKNELLGIKLVLSRVLSERIRKKNIN